MALGLQPPPSASGVWKVPARPAGAEWPGCGWPWVLTNRGADDRRRRSVPAGLRFLFRWHCQVKQTARSCRARFRRRCGLCWPTGPSPAVAACSAGLGYACGPGPATGPLLPGCRRPACDRPRKAFTEQLLLGETAGPAVEAHDNLRVAP